MASETINVYIDTDQLNAQKNNHYSLFLAKMVNKEFTVIWQSRGPRGDATHPSYTYQNTFVIAVPSYAVNYGTLAQTNGSVTFSAAGKPQSIDLGQSVELTANGVFGTPKNDGTSGEVTIKNSLASNPHATLLDDSGNPIFVDTQSGMDIGTTTLTPVDTYQIWFDSYQDTGSIIAHNVSKPYIVTFSGGDTNKDISYNRAGEWQNGKLSRKLDLAGGLGAGVDITIAVIAIFKYALTAAAVTYLTSKLMDKFASGLKPKKISTEIGSAKLQIDFEDSKNLMLVQVGLDIYETAVDQALTKAKDDKSSDLGNETWILTEPTITVSY
jgi:hypothetical protein